MNLIQSAFGNLTPFCVIMSETSLLQPDSVDFKILDAYTSKYPKATYMSLQS